MSILKTVAFSGYRPNKLPNNGEPCAEINMLKKSIKDCVKGLINEGFTHFLTGMADGFDTFATETLLVLKENHPHIKIIAVLAFDDPKNALLAFVDEKIVIAKGYSQGVYHERNDYLINQASLLVCYYDGRYGGTEYTYEQAIKKNLKVINLWESIAIEARPPKMVDNKRTGKIIDELRNNLKKGSKVSVISAYFTIYAFAAIKRELSRVESFRLIFTEPTFLKNDKEITREYYLYNKFSGNEFEIKLRNEMKQAATARDFAKWLEKKNIEIKSLRTSNSAQPRLIYIESKADNVAINGTVDFTTDGFGLTHSNRIDSNMCIYGKDFTANFKVMFDELWNNPKAVQDVKAQVLEYMGVLYVENTPEFIYFVTVHKVFRDIFGELSEDNIIKTRTGFKDSLIWNKLFDFQKSGVVAVIERIEKWGGCILADSVGLGKTFTALAVIKYYLLRNDRVLVLAPKKLRENWSIYTLNDRRNLFAGDRFKFDVLNHTDLSRSSGMSGEINLSTINWSNYDLVVIDESHNFRNNHPVKGKVTRYDKLMKDIIKSGVKTKVLMLSATPVNNRMNDIKNQIAFITESNDKAFDDIGISSVEQVLRKAQAVFNRWSLFPDEKRTTDTFVEMMDLDYFKLLDTVTFARSRKHIVKYYNLDNVGKFPSRKKPINIFSEIDISNEFPHLEDVNRVIKKLLLPVYSPLLYVLPEKVNIYNEKYDTQVSGGASTFRQVDRERQLVRLMRINMLKRMESSIYSFAKTVENILNKITDTLNLIDKNAETSVNDDLDIADIDLDDSEFESLVTGSKVKVLLSDMDLIRWHHDLLSDKEKLETILAEARKITPKRDAKLKKLTDLILNKSKSPINVGNKKVLVFTAFADTANYLYENLHKVIPFSTAVVTGSGNNRSTVVIPKELSSQIRLTDLNTVLTLFSPKSKDKAKIFPDMLNEIDLLIGTDCISEGQNLQDCDYLINYDIHWNPVRIIQRFGRIDRIGSLNDEIQLVNFWPNVELDEYINLRQRVQGRMVLSDVSATGGDNLLAADEEEMKDLEYRRKQLERLQTEVVDLEDISGGISITDLTFNDLKTELADYIKSNGNKLEAAPNGMYAICSIPEDMEGDLNSGVIFALKQIKGIEQTRDDNALFPYYLVYVADDGEVKYSFLHAKKLLDYYKKLCKGKNEVLKKFIVEFNKKTADGTDMGIYSKLLVSAVENIIGKKRELGVASLFSKGGTSFQKEIFDGMEDFELISFLILKKG